MNLVLVDDYLWASLLIFGSAGNVKTLKQFSTFFPCKIRDGWVMFTCNNIKMDVSAKVQRYN